MDDSLIAKIEIPTTIQKDDGSFAKGIGTAYPIGKGIVITARHVLYPEQVEHGAMPKLIWKKSDEEEPYHQSVASKIIFEDERFDIALLACEVPKTVENKVILSSRFPDSDEGWESFGFPKGGKKAGERIKKPAKGQCFSPDHDSYIQELKSDGNADDFTLWKGMSGAPVFSNKTKMLIGILIRTPDRYKVNPEKPESEYKDTFNNRLIAASIPYLLKNGKCPAFKEAINIESDEGAYKKIEKTLRESLGLAQSAVWKEIAKNETNLAENAQDIVAYLVNLSIPDLIDLFDDAQQQNTETSTRQQLASLLKLLLPTLYDPACVAQLSDTHTKDSTVVIELPYSTAVSAEILMSGVDGRELDLIFRKISSINSDLVAYPGCYRLALPAEKGATSPQQLFEDMEDDLIKRILGDDDIDSIEIDIDEYLYQNIPQHSNQSRTREEKQKAVQRELQRRKKRGRNKASYYWIVMTNDQHKAHRWNEVANILKKRYPEIRLLCLNNDFDQEEDEKDAFVRLPNVLETNCQ